MFVTLEGPEGSGKSTVVQMLAERLRGSGLDVLTTREPGAGEVGQAVRQILLHGESIEPLTELFLFLADRSEHVAKTVRPALARGQVVLCDRHADSTVVYQGYARGLDLARLRSLNELATGGLKPDLTLLLDLDVKTGIARTQDKDRLDNEPIEFHERVRAGFLAEADLEPGRWKVVDASRPLDEVVEECWKALTSHPLFATV